MYIGVLFGKIPISAFNFEPLVSMFFAAEGSNPYDYRFSVCQRTSAE